MCYSAGWAYFNNGNYEEALYMFEKALEFRKQQGDSATIPTARWAVGKALRMMNHTEEALEIQQELFQDYQAAGRKNGFVYEEIAECLFAMDRGDEAQDWFAAAYSELSKDRTVAGDTDRLNRLKTLGKVGFQQKTYEAI